MKPWQIIAVPFSSEPGHDMWRGPKNVIDSMGFAAWRELPVPLVEPSPTAWEKLCRQFQKDIAPDLDSQKPWLFIAGECTVAPIPVGALQAHHPEIQVVWIDAHGDIHTPESSHSKFLGGMPLNLLLGGSLESVRIAAGARPVLRDHVTMVGTRDLDPPETQYLQSYGLTPLYAESTIVDRIKTINLPAYVHVDVDVLDPKENPAASYASPQGMSLNTLRSLISALLSTGLVRAVTVCAYSPAFDVEQQGLHCVQEVIQTILAS